MPNEIEIDLSVDASYFVANSRFQPSKQPERFLRFRNSYERAEMNDTTEQNALQMDGLALNQVRYYERGYFYEAINSYPVTPTMPGHPTRVCNALQSHAAHTLQDVFIFRMKLLSYLYRNTVLQHPLMPRQYAGQQQRSPQRSPVLYDRPSVPQAAHAIPAARHCEWRQDGK